jgi:hypothetical protein
VWENILLLPFPGAIFAILIARKQIILFVDALPLFLPPLH